MTAPERPRRHVDAAMTRDVLIVAVLQLLAERHSPPHPDADTESRHMRYMANVVDNAARNHAVMLAGSAAQDEPDGAP